MKKLIYLLVFSLCLNGMAGFTPAWLNSARTAHAAEAKAEKKSTKKSSKKKKEDKKEKKSKKDSSTVVVVAKKTEKEYKLDLSKNSQFLLSDALKISKCGIKLKKVKSIELVNKKDDKKLISWEKDKENGKDYVFTVLKDFKKLKLRIKTKDGSVILVLKNGAKAREDSEPLQSEPDAQAQEESSSSKAEDANTVQEPTEVEKQDDVPEEPKAEKQEETPEAPQAQNQEEAPEIPEAEKQEETPEVSEAEKQQEVPEAPEAEKQDETPEAPEAGNQQDDPEKTGDGVELKEEPSDDAAEDNQKTDAATTEDVAGDADVAEGSENATVMEDLPADSAENDGQSESGIGQEMDAAVSEGESISTEADATAVEGEGASTEGEDTAAETEDTLIIEDDGAAEQAEDTLIVEGDSAAEQVEDAAAVELEDIAEQIEDAGSNKNADDDGQETTQTSDESQEKVAPPTVTAENLVEKQWTNTKPVFTLSGIPEGKDWVYAAIITKNEILKETANDGATVEEEPENKEQTETVKIEGNEYVPDVEGAYTLSFAIMDGETVKSISEESYSLQLDWTPPVVTISADEMRDYTLVVNAVDDASGVKDISVNGSDSESWFQVKDPDQIEHNISIINEAETTYPAGQIVVRDVAGNVFISQEDYTAGVATGKPELTVTVNDLKKNKWSTIAPTFMLSGIPEGKENWSFKVMCSKADVYDKTIDSGGLYVTDEEGMFNLQFIMLDEHGDYVSWSEEYTLMLDWTPPEVEISNDEETDFKVNIYATDNASGVDAVSVDKGKNWHKMDEEGYYSFTDKEETTYEAGTIQVRDVAGNIYYSEEEVIASEAEEGEEEGEEEGGEEGGGGLGGGGGGGGGSGTPALPHASGDGDEGAEYDALPLDLPDEPMRQLTVGGEPMDLTLTLDSAQGSGAPVGASQYFTASLKCWDGDPDDTPDTLVLQAQLADNLGDQFAYDWSFNGEVYRLLANSGIRYVALQVGDAVAAFPTEGFTGGTKYTELKMRGVSTRRFDYRLIMRLNLDPSHVTAMTENDYSQDCDLSIHAKVEDIDYELSNSPKSIMYFYNVFVGPAAMMNQPFGEYSA